MELEFDKEIDALLRKARSGGPVYVGGVVGPHLDADAIAAFAENAMPQKTRELHMTHLADCSECRKILSGFISLNRETEAASAAAAAPAFAAEQPWYRNLFAMPNLAYGMGTLVLVFAGFLGYMVLQNSGGSYSEISQVSETRAPASGPMANDGEFYAANSANATSSAASSSNTAANSSGSGVTSNMAPTGTTAAPTPALTDAVAPPPAPTAEKNVSGADVALAKPANEEPKEADKDDALLNKKTEGARIEPQKRPDEQKVMREQPYDKQMPSAGAPMAKQAGPNRGQQRDNRSQSEAEMRAKSTQLGATSDYASNRRQVSGKTFERKQGVWYDTVFQGHPTINVRRGSEGYRKLDSGLRTIAENLDGTVVVVWGSKAYRFQ